MGALMGLALLPACAQEHAGLEVTVTPPVVSRFVVHGNCFVGWFLAVELVVRETSGVDVTVESVSLRVEDATGRLLGERTVDAAEIAAGSGQPAAIPAHGSIVIPMSIGPLEGAADAPAIDDPVVTSGSILAADEGGEVHRAYRVPSAVSVVADPMPTSGACSAPIGQGAASTR